LDSKVVGCWRGIKLSHTVGGREGTNVDCWLDDGTSAGDGPTNLTERLKRRKGEASQVPLEWGRRRRREWLPGT